jgi:hypothetical protein
MPDKAGDIYNDELVLYFLKSESREDETPFESFNIAKSRGDKEKDSLRWWKNVRSRRSRTG